MTTRRILIKEYEFGTRTPTRNYKRRRVEQRNPFVFISSNTVGKISQASKTFRFRIILREIKRHIPFRDGIFDSTKSLCGSYLRCDEWRPPQWSNGTLSFLRRAVCSVAESKIREGKHKADNKLVRCDVCATWEFPHSTLFVFLLVLLPCNRLPLWKLTNWQSRTAMTIMPAFFVFALTSEHKLNHRMQEVAEENEHAIKSVEWAEKRHRQSTFSNDEQKLRQLYRQSVLNSGVQLVDTPELGMHHRMANYLVTNPFKIIAAIGVPAVAYIYYGRSGKNHLSFSLKILHTRVFGQFAVICTLLGVMGLKEYLDQRCVCVSRQLLCAGFLSSVRCFLTTSSLPISFSVVDS